MPEHLDTRARGRRSLLRSGCALLLLLPGLTGCAKAPAPGLPAPGGATTPTGGAGTGGLRKVKLLLNWFPEAEHGGYYAALVHGYYREAGLDVEIVPGGPNVPVIQQTAGRQVEFSVANADPILFGRAGDAPVVAVMAPLQVSPRCIMVHKESGIRSFEDLRNVTLAMSSTGAFSHYLRKRFPLEGVRVVPYSGSVAPFLLDKRYAQQGYVFSEPHVARGKGADPTVLSVADVGFNPYTSCLVTHQELIREEPEMVRNMVEASVRGWEKYLREPQDANARIHDLNPEMEMSLLALGAKDLIPLVRDKVAVKEGIGHMSEERWNTLARQLIEIGQLKEGEVRAAEAYSTAFLTSGDRLDPAR
jgi:NitT/TauT family transport system substrate-binding protein